MTLYFFPPAATKQSSNWEDDGKVLRKNRVDHTLATRKNKTNHLTSCLDKVQMSKNSLEWLQTNVWWRTGALLSFWTSRDMVFSVHCRGWVIQLETSTACSGSWGVNYSHRRQMTAHSSCGEMTKSKQKMGLAVLLRTQNLLDFLSLGLSGRI